MVKRLKTEVGMELLEGQNKRSWMILGSAYCPRGTIHTLPFPSQEDISWIINILTLYYTPPHCPIMGMWSVSTNSVKVPSSDKGQEGRTTLEGEGRKIKPRKKDKVSDR